MQKASENEIGLERRLAVMRRLVIVAAISVLLIFGWYAFNDNDSVSAPTLNDINQSIQYEGCLAVVDAESEECVLVEIVREHEDTVLGLSGRDSLKDGTGMLFDFSEGGRRCMWMKDMNFGLDMVWLDDKRRITTIEESVLPESFPDAFCGGEQDRYVLEVNEGVVSEQGFVVGGRVNW